MRPRPSRGPRRFSHRMPGLPHSRPTPSCASAADDTVTVLIKHIEFGQGPFTGLATLVAEELDADWSKVRAEHAPSNPELYKNLAFGVQGTGGSSAIANSYEQMRKAGATARAMLVDGGGAGLARAGRRDHGRARRAAARENRAQRPVRPVRAGRGAVAGAGERTAQGPVRVPADRPRRRGQEARQRRPRPTAPRSSPSTSASPACSRSSWRGHPASAERSSSFEAGDALAVRGVVDVKEIPSGVAVYAEGMWPALKGREKLRVTWDEASAEKRSSDQLIEEYRRLVTQARHGCGPAWRCGSRARPRRAGDRGGVRLSLSGACADGAAGRLPALGWRARAGAPGQPAADGRPPDHCRRARPQARSGAARDHAGRRQLRPPCANHHAPRGRAGACRQGDRSRAARSSWCGRARTTSAAATTGRCSCIACAAPSATARSSRGRIRSWASPSSRGRCSRP